MMDKVFRALYNGDMERYEGKPSWWTRCFHFYLRKTQTCGSRLLKAWYHLCYRITGGKHRMEISYGARIGKGFLLLDPWLVTINSNAVIGENVTLGRNVTIGKQNRGSREGSPVIGNRVTIGTNAVIVGRITIGDGARIAPDSYVNRDIPPEADVSGNPCVISACEDENCGVQ